MTLFRVCLTVAEFVLSAAAGVWLLRPPAGDWDLSLWGEAAGDFFFFSPASFFLQAWVLCEPELLQKVQLRFALSTVQVFDLWPLAPHKKHLINPSFFLNLSRFGVPPPPPAGLVHLVLAL